MKVLYIVNSTIWGGATISFINMILGLKSFGILPVVVSPKTSPQTQFDSILSREKIVHYKATLVESVITKIPSSHVLHWLKVTLFKPYKKIVSKRDLEKIILLEYPDIIHTNVGPIHEGLLVAHKYGIPHVWHLREYQTLDFHFKIIPSINKFRSLLLKSEIITITDDIRHYFNLENYSHAQTIYNGIYAKDNLFYSYPKEKFFLCASRISPEKGHESVIRAFSEFLKFEPTYRLKIIGFGSDWYIDYLKKIAQELNCIENIDFPGFQEDVSIWMKKTSGLIVASRFEGFGRMTAEALFCGSIVIGRNTGGTKEIISKTGGYLFDTHNELVNQMRIVSSLSKEDYYHQICKSQKIASELYSIENNVKSVFTVYEHILLGS